MSDEDWVESAVADDSLVAHLLMDLHKALPPPPPPPPTIHKTNLSPNFPLHWSVRQRRSRPPLKSAPTSSPTTPLSWSGGNSSVSGGGFEESSQPPSNRPDASRSKVNATYGTSTSKRTKKRKNLCELKEEEMLLLKERRSLKRELAKLRMNLLEQRAANERLKRLKVDSESQFAAEAHASPPSVDVIPEKVQEEPATCDLTPSVAQAAEVALSTPPIVSSKLQQQDANNEEDNFMLPDLNLSIEDSNSGVLVPDRVS